MDYNVTMLEDLPDIDEIESQANHMYTQNSIIPNDMYNKFKGNLRAAREIPSEAGMNTVKYMGNYTPVPVSQPVLNSNFPVTQVPQQITLPIHTTQFTQNQVPTYYMQPPITTISQPISTPTVVQESFTSRPPQFEKPQMAEITMSTERYDSPSCDCTSTLKGYLVAIIILLIIFILLLLYFLRVLNNLTVR